MLSHSFVHSLILPNKMAAENKQQSSPDIKKLMEAHANVLQDITQIGELLQAVRIDKVVSSQTPEDLLVVNEDPNVVVPTVCTPRLPPATIKLVFEGKARKSEVDTAEAQVNAVAGNRMRNDQRTGISSQPTRVELDFLEKHNRLRTEYDSKRPQYDQAENDQKHQLELLDNNKARHRAKVKLVYESLSDRITSKFPQNFLTLSPDEQLILIEQLLSLKKLSEIKTSTDLQTEQSRLAKAALLEMEASMVGLVNQLVSDNVKHLPTGTDIDAFRAAVEKCVTDQTHLLYLSADRNYAKLIQSAVVVTTEGLLDDVP